MAVSWKPIPHEPNHYRRTMERYFVHVEGLTLEQAIAKVDRMLRWMESNP